jgi:hypothetical protein
VECDVEAVLVDDDDRVARVAQLEQQVGEARTSVQFRPVVGSLSRM